MSLLTFLLLLFLCLFHPARTSVDLSDPNVCSCNHRLQLRESTEHLTTPPKPLIARPGVPFRIALFADLHFGEDAWTEWGPWQDVNSVRVMSTVLDHEVPDFVVYLGDVVTANNIMIANASLYWDVAVSPARSRGIPFSSVFGNHDDAAFQWPVEWFSSPGIPPIQCPSSKSSPSRVEEDCSFKGTGRLQLMKAETDRNQLSFSSSGPRELWPSISNYALQLSTSDKPRSSIAYLYFLDSGGGSYPEVLSKAQVDWFRTKSREINPDSRQLLDLDSRTSRTYEECYISVLNTPKYSTKSKNEAGKHYASCSDGRLLVSNSVPELIFWHIPSKAYEKVAPVPGSGISKPCVGSINMEKVAPQETEEGVMGLLWNRSSVKAIFVGHNHGLDWCCPYNKLWLCYARHTGYGGYGDWPRGARIVEINQKPFSVKTWIRMEDGDVHSEVVLGVNL